MRTRLSSLIATSVCLFVLGSAASASGQTVTDERVWTTFSAQGRLKTKSRWRWSADTLARTRDGARTLDVTGQGLVIGRDLTSRSRAAFGYAYRNTFLDGDGTQRENRLYEQYVWGGGTNHGTLSVRSRLEERYVEGNDGVAVRTRQFVRASWPIAAAGRLAFVTSEELSLYINSTSRFARGFDSNRVLVGARQTVTNRSAVEVGYLNLYAHTGPGRHRRSHILSATVTLSI